MSRILRDWSSRIVSATLPVGETVSGTYEVYCMYNSRVRLGATQVG